MYTERILSGRQEFRIIRGGEYGYQNRVNGGWASDDVLLRPVLELPQALAYDAMKPVTLYLNGTTIGSGETASAPEKIKVVVKSGESYPAPTAAGLTPPQVGIIGAELQWVDNNGNYYNPGDPVPAEVEQLTASWFRLDQGPQGEKGEQGEQGEKGEKGDQGDPGTDGTTPELKIGEDGIWYVSYDKGATWTSLGIKATGANGEKGDRGETGATGETGAAGQNGAKGADGKDGASGKDGQTPYVGENGNWWIGEEDTGVKAKVSVTSQVVTVSVAGAALAGNLGWLGWFLQKRRKGILR